MKTVLMVIICFVPAGRWEIAEAWRIEQKVSLEHCLAMNQVMSGGGKGSAITVKCGSYKEEGSAP